MNSKLLYEKSFVLYPGGVPAKTDLNRSTQPIYRFHNEKWIKVVKINGDSDFKASLTPIKEAIDPLEVFKRLSEKRTRIMSATKPRVPSASETQNIYKLSHKKNSMAEFYNELQKNRSVVQNRDIRSLWKQYKDKIDTNKEEFRKNRELVFLELKDNIVNNDLSDPFGYLIENRQIRNNKRIITAILQWKISSQELKARSNNINSKNSSSSIARPHTVL